MGLDMYLNKYPRYKDTIPCQISVMESYFDLKEAQANGEYLDSDLKSWSGYEDSELPKQDVMDFYRPYYKHRYGSWDTEQKYGYKCIHQNLASWRKANQIHAWFVENVQNGVDDCGDYIVSEDILEELLSICKQVKEKAVLAPGKVENGYTMYPDGRSEYNYEDGFVVTNPGVCEELLPTQAGFFFGSTQYDSYYMRDIDQTIEILEKVLKETDFVNEAVYYTSSW